MFSAQRQNKNWWWNSMQFLSDRFRLSTKQNAIPTSLHRKDIRLDSAAEIRPAASSAPPASGPPICPGSEGWRLQLQLDRSCRTTNAAWKSYGTTRPKCVLPGKGCPGGRSCPRVGSAVLLWAWFRLRYQHPGQLDRLAWVREGTRARYVSIFWGVFGYYGCQCHGRFPESDLAEFGVEKWMDGMYRGMGNIIITIQNFE